MNSETFIIGALITVLNGIVLFVIKSWFNTNIQRMKEFNNNTIANMRDHCDTVNKHICIKFDENDKTHEDLWKKLNRHGHKGLDGDAARVTNC